MGADNTLYDQKICGIFVGVDTTFIRHNRLRPHIISRYTCREKTWLHYETNAKGRDAVLQAGVVVISAHHPFDISTLLSVIFCLTFILAIMIMTAPPGIKNIVAQCVIFQKHQNEFTY